ncbi:probable RNA helicase SDE3 isoform X2 [Quercus robur]|uniref:probable RNA helicase SDE3 isoform X2 n=1 Tax=Quercus robur TaxID=38942 RepID=UPI002161EDF5|nr:probable RNA helicase SDE3 isoform X2 [Quercus robur]
MWWFLRKIFELVSGFLKSSNESSGKSNSVTDKPQHVNQPTFSSTPLQSPSKPPSYESSNPLPHTFSSGPSTSSSNLSPSPSSLKPPVASVLNTSQLRHGSVLNTSQLSRASVLNTRQLRYGSVLNTSQLSDAYVLNTSQLSQASVPNTRQLRYGSVLNTSQLSRASVLNTSQLRHASVLNTTQLSSASSSPTSKRPPQSSLSVVPNSSTLGPRQTSTKQPPAFKPILHPAPNNVTNEEGKMSYMYEKGTPLYAIPEDIKGQIKRDIVPQVLKQPLSPSTYKAFFAALLYAEDYYLEKWTDFLLEKVTLKLEKATVYKEKNEHKYSDGSDEKDDKIFVAFEIDSVPQRRPFLLSRDMVYAKPSDKEVEAFQHHPNRKYDISFSFNRVCLKRAHQAIEAALGPSSHNFLFPECVSRKNNVNPPLFDAYHELNIVRRILSYPGSPPYLLVGPLIGTDVERYVPELKASARTGVVVCEAVIEIYKTSEENRVLICAPINHTCDALMTRLMEVIPESDMFRANAAFREMDGVPSDILRSCPVKDECFECPPLPILQEFKIILSTYVSSFRLYNEGIAAGHFSHIFLVDASSTTEPEATIALANFANENTSVIVTGAPRDHSGWDRWVRSNMARNYGLRKSYFERLREREPYKNLNPMFITELVDCEQQSDGSHSSMSFY